MLYKKMSLIVLVLCITLYLFACQNNEPDKTETEIVATDEYLVREAKLELGIVFTGAEDSISSVTETIILQTKINDVNVSWTTDHNDIINTNGVVNRPEVDTVVRLTATLSLNETSDTKTFDVTVIAVPVVIDYGLVVINDIVVYINSNRISTYAKIEPLFTKDEMKEELTYSVISGDSRIITIDDQYIVKARQTTSGTVVMKAESLHFSTQFSINVVYHNYNDPDFMYFDRFNTTRFDVNGSRLKLKDLDLTDTTVVIGDSFTADGFIGTFMKDYSADKLIINAGISATTSYHWEAAFSHIIGDSVPKNIVINIGTNNFYDGNGGSVEDIVKSIERLFMYMHSKYPETKIYYWGISQRANTTHADGVTEANLRLKQFIDTTDYITFVDAKLTTADYYDGLHPTYQGYIKMFDALEASGIEIVEKN